MKENILKLRNEGKTYNEIKELLNCSKGTIAYHCGLGQKEKAIKRTNKRRSNILLAKIENFKFRKNKNSVEVIRKFQKRDSLVKHRVNKDMDKTFTWADVLAKFGKVTKCYLTGEEIDLSTNTYEVDHIIPVSRGGDNSLQNLGILTTVANRIKNSLTPKELIDICIKVLKHNGYTITKETQITGLVSMGSPKPS